MGNAGIDCASGDCSLAESVAIEGSLPHCIPCGTPQGFLLVGKTRKSPLSPLFFIYFQLPHLSLTSLTKSIILVLQDNVLLLNFSPSTVKNRIEHKKLRVLWSSRSCVWQWGCAWGGGGERRKNEHSSAWLYEVGALLQRSGLMNIGLLGKHSSSFQGVWGAPPGGRMSVCCGKLPSSLQIEERQLLVWQPGWPANLAFSLLRAFVLVQGLLTVALTDLLGWIILFGGHCPVCPNTFSSIPGMLASLDAWMLIHLAPHWMPAAFPNPPHDNQTGLQTLTNAPWGTVALLENTAVPVPSAPHTLPQRSIFLAPYYRHILVQMLPIEPILTILHNSADCLLTTLPPLALFLKFSWPWDVPYNTLTWCVYICFLSLEYNLLEGAVLSLLLPKHPEHMVKKQNKTGNQEQNQKHMQGSHACPVRGALSSPPPKANNHCFPVTGLSF